MTNKKLGEWGIFSAMVAIVGGIIIVFGDHYFEEKKGDNELRHKNDNRLSLVTWLESRDGHNKKQTNQPHKTTLFQ